MAKSLPRRLLAVVMLLLLPATVGALAVVRLLMPPALAVPPKAEIFLTDVTVIEPGRTRLDHQDVWIAGGRVASITPSAGESKTATLTGGYVLPGLIDMHVHFPPAVAIGQTDLWATIFLAHGVTTVRDVGSTPNLVNAKMRMLLLDASGRDHDTGLRHLPVFWDSVWRAATPCRRGGAHRRAPRTDGGNHPTAPPRRCCDLCGNRCPYALCRAGFEPARRARRPGGGGADDRGRSGTSST